MALANYEPFVQELNNVLDQPAAFPPLPAGKEIEDKIKMLSTASTIRCLSATQQLRAASAAEIISYASGEIISAAGVDFALVICLSGKISIQKINTDTYDFGPTEIKRAGDYFGEESLDSDNSMSLYTATADGPTECLVLPIDAFEAAITVDKLVGFRDERVNGGENAPWCWLLDELGALKEEGSDDEAIAVCVDIIMRQVSSKAMRDHHRDVVANMINDGDDETDDGQDDGTDGTYHPARVQIIASPLVQEFLGYDRVLEHGKRKANVPHQEVATESSGIISTTYPYGRTGRDSATRVTDAVGLSLVSKSVHNLCIKSISEQAIRSGVVGVIERNHQVDVDGRFARLCVWKLVANGGDVNKICERSRNILTRYILSRDHGPIDLCHDALDHFLSGNDHHRHNASAHQLNTSLHRATAERTLSALLQICKSTNLPPPLILSAVEEGELVGVAFTRCSPPSNDHADQKAKAATRLREHFQAKHPHRRCKVVHVGEGECSGYKSGDDMRMMERLLLDPRVVAVAASNPLRYGRFPQLAMTPIRVSQAVAQLPGRSNGPKILIYSKSAEAPSIEIEKEILERSSIHLLDFRRNQNMACGVSSSVGDLTYNAKDISSPTAMDSIPRPQGRGEITNPGDIRLNKFVADETAKKGGVQKVYKSKSVSPSQRGAYRRFLVRKWKLRGGRFLDLNKRTGLYDEKDETKCMNVVTRILDKL